MINFKNPASFIGPDFGLGEHAKGALKHAGKTADWITKKFGKKAMFASTAGALGGAMLIRRKRNSNIGNDSGTMGYGSSAGLENAPSAYIAQSGTGYDNPYNQNARYNTKMSLPYNQSSQDMYRPQPRMNSNDSMYDYRYDSSDVNHDQQFSRMM